MNQRRFQVFTRPPENKKRRVWDGRQRAGRPAARSPLRARRKRGQGPGDTETMARLTSVTRQSQTEAPFTSASVWYKHSKQARRRPRRGQDSDEDEHGVGREPGCEGAPRRSDWGWELLSHKMRGEGQPVRNQPRVELLHQRGGTGRRTSSRRHGTSSPGRGTTPSWGHEPTSSRLRTSVLTGDAQSPVSGGSRQQGVLTGDLQQQADGLLSTECSCELGGALVLS